MLGNLMVCRYKDVKKRGEGGGGCNAKNADPYRTAARLSERERGREVACENHNKREYDSPFPPKKETGRDSDDLCPLQRIR